MKVTRSFLHRRTNQGGHAGKGAGEKSSLAFAMGKKMGRGFLYGLEALDPTDSDMLEKL